MASEIVVGATPQEQLTTLKKEVQDECSSTKDKVYKEALKSIMRHHDSLQKQANYLQKELAKTAEAQEALDQAYLQGLLISREDAKRIFNKVLYGNSAFKKTENDEDDE